MAQTVRVSFINKTDRSSAHERSQNIGGANPNGTRWWMPVPVESRPVSWKPRAVWAAAGCITGSRRTPRRAGPSRSAAATGARPGRLMVAPGTGGPRHARHPDGPRAGRAATQSPAPHQC